MSENGKFTLVLGIPLQPPVHGGTDNIAASTDGALAVRLAGHGDLVILDPPALEATREVYVTVTEIIRGAMDDPNVISDAVIRVLAMVWFAALFARVRGWEEPRQMGDDLENAVRLLLPDGR